MAEVLQKKYSKRWKENKRILYRIHSFHLKAKRIMEDSAKKAGKWVVEVAKDLGANVIKLENLNKLIFHVSELSPEFRDRLYLIQYRSVQRWIEWQAKKHGMTVEHVPAFYSSVACPNCGKKMKETSHRWFSCSCCYENDRDVVAIANLWEVFSEPLDCPSNEICNLESMRGTLARRGGSQLSYFCVECDGHRRAYPQELIA